MRFETRDERLSEPSIPTFLLRIANLARNFQRENHNSVQLSKH